MPSPGSPGPFFQAPGGPIQDGLGDMKMMKLRLPVASKKGGWVIQWYLYKVR